MSSKKTQLKQQKTSSGKVKSTKRKNDKANGNEKMEVDLGNDQVDEILFAVEAALQMLIQKEQFTQESLRKLLEDIENCDLEKIVKSDGVSKSENSKKSTFVSVSHTLCSFERYWQGLEKIDSFRWPIWKLKELGNVILHFISNYPLVLFLRVDQRCIALGIVKPGYMLADIDQGAGKASVVSVKAMSDLIDKVQTIWPDSKKLENEEEHFETGPNVELTIAVLGETENLPNLPQKTPSKVSSEDGTETEGETNTNSSSGNEQGSDKLLESTSSFILVPEDMSVPENLMEEEEIGNFHVSNLAKVTCFFYTEEEEEEEEEEKEEEVNNESSSSSSASSSTSASSSSASSSNPNSSGKNMSNQGASKLVENVPQEKQGTPCYFVSLPGGEYNGGVKISDSQNEGEVKEQDKGNDSLKANEKNVPEDEGLTPSDSSISSLLLAEADENQSSTEVSSSSSMKSKGEDDVEEGGKEQKQELTTKDEGEEWAKWTKPTKCSLCDEEITDDPFKLSCDHTLHVSCCHNWYKQLIDMSTAAPIAVLNCPVVGCNKEIDLAEIELLITPKMMIKLRQNLITSGRCKRFECPTVGCGVVKFMSPESSFICQQCGYPTENTDSTN